MALLSHEKSVPTFSRWWEHGYVGTDYFYPHLALFLGACYPYGMTVSESNRKRWRKVPKNKRSKLLARAASFRWLDKTPEERRAHAMLMVRARNKNESDTVLK